MERTTGGPSWNAALAVVLTLLALLPPTAVQASPQVPSRPPAPGDACPFPLAAPWPAGQVWMAGNGGNFYGDGSHLGAELFAVDFNRTGAEDEGQPIYAAADGLVLSAGWLTGYGNAVILAHRQGVLTTYGHFLLVPRVAAGQHVSTGTVLGLCGSTGDSTGPHLHFSVRCGSVALRPEPMEGRRLADGILLLAAPKPAGAGDEVVLADLLRAPAERPSAEATAAEGGRVALVREAVWVEDGGRSPRGVARGGPGRR